MNRALPEGLLSQLNVRNEIETKYGLDKLLTSATMRELLRAVENSLISLGDIKLKKESECLLEELRNNDSESPVLDLDLLRRYSETHEKSNLFHYLAYHNKAIEFNKIVQILPMDNLAEFCKAEDAHFLTPLMVAVANNSIEFVIAMSKLRSFFWFCNVQNKYGYNPLMCALLMNKLEVALILAKKKVDAAALSKGNLSALMLLFRLGTEGNEKLCLEIYKAIVKIRGGHKAYKNKTAAEYCIEVKNLFLFKEYLKDFPKIVNSKNKMSGFTPLIAACSAVLHRTMRSEFIRIITSVPGVNLESKSNNGMSALEYFINNCADNEEEAEIALLLTNDAHAVANVLSKAIKKSKLTLVNCLLKQLGNNIPSDLYRDAFQQIRKQYIRSSAASIPRNFTLLDTLIEKDPSCGSWTTGDLMRNMEVLTPNVAFTRKALEYSIKHMNESSIAQKPKGYLHSAISLGCSLYDSHFLRLVIKYNIERLDEKVSFVPDYSERSNINHRPREITRMNGSGAIKCHYCKQQAKNSVYAGETRGYQSCIDNNNFACTTCSYLKKESITNGEYMMFKNKICEYNLAMFDSKIGKHRVSPEQLETAYSAKLDAVLLEKLSERQRQLIGL